MQLSLGVLGWSSKDFWSSTYVEFCTAIEGWKECNGVKEEPVGATGDEMLDMMERFPDNG
jgi:hypothetical protein